LVYEFGLRLAASYLIRWPEEWSTGSRAELRPETPEALRIDPIDVRPWLAGLAKDSVAVRDEPLGLLCTTQVAVGQTEDANSSLGEGVALGGTRRPW